MDKKLDLISKNISKTDILTPQKQVITSSPTMVEVTKSSIVPSSWEINNEKLFLIEEENKSLFVFNNTFPQYINRLSIDPRLPSSQIFSNVFTLLKINPYTEKPNLIHIFRDIIINPNVFIFYNQSEPRLQKLIVRKSYQVLLSLHILNKLFYILDASLKPKDLVVYQKILAGFFKYSTLLSVTFEFTKSNYEQLDDYKIKMQNIRKEGYCFRSQISNPFDFMLDYLQYDHDIKFINIYISKRFKKTRRTIMINRGNAFYDLIQFLLNESSVPKYLEDFGGVTFWFFQKTQVLLSLIPYFLISMYTLRYVYIYRFKIIYPTSIGLMVKQTKDVLNK